MLLPFEERFGPRDDYGAVMPEAEVQRIADGGGANAMDGRGELTLGPPAKPLGPFAATPKPGHADRNPNLKPQPQPQPRPQPQPHPHPHPHPHPQRSRTPTLTPTRHAEGGATSKDDGTPMHLEGPQDAADEVS